MAKTNRKILFGLFLTCLLIESTYAQPDIYLIRHAEKVANWPEGDLDVFHPLNITGMATSRRIAKYFADISVDQIYSSATTRSLHTALPLARIKNLAIMTEPACFDTSAITGFLARINTEEADAVALFTHSNIIPYILIKSGLTRDCWNEMGIAKSRESDWLLISGYKHIWRIKQQNRGNSSCEGFTRLQF